MFSHAPELLRASLRLELARVFEKNLEPGSQRGGPQVRLPRLCDLRVVPSFFLAMENSLAYVYYRNDRSEGTP